MLEEIKNCQELYYKVKTCHNLFFLISSLKYYVMGEERFNKLNLSVRYFYSKLFAVQGSEQYSFKFVYNITINPGSRYVKKRHRASVAQDRVPQDAL